MRFARRLKLCGAALCCAAVAALPAPAADPPPRPWTIDFSGEVRLRAEYRNDNDLRRESDDERREGLQRVRLGVSVERPEEVRIFIQAQDSRVAGEEGSTLSDEENLDLHQGYVEVRAFGRSGLLLYAGRREWVYGDERLVGSFGWSNFGRAFDGVTLRWRRPRLWADGFFGQVDHDLAPDGQTRGDSLFGAYAQWAPRAGDEWEGYAMVFRGSAEEAGEAGVSGTSRVEVVGARARSKVKRLEYTLEAAVQRGRLRGNGHRAWAAAAQLGLHLGSAKRWRALAGYDFATGDRSAADGEDNEFFNFFPTNHPHYGAMDLFGWRNLESAWVGASFVSGRHRAQVKLHDFRLEEAGGAWKDAAGSAVPLGFDSTGQSGRDVGQEVDLSYRFQWTDRLLLDVGLSRFGPDEFAESTRGSDPSHFGYLMLTVGF